MTVHSFTHTPFSRQTGQTSLKTGKDHNTRHHHTDLAVGLKAGTDHNTRQHHTDLAVGLKTGTDHNTKHHTDLATGLKVELHGQTSLNIGTDHITQHTDLATGLKVELHGQTNLNTGTHHITQHTDMTPKNTVLATGVKSTDFGGSRVGFALGSSRPLPAGLVSASSAVISSSSISTLPCNHDNSPPQRHQRLAFAAAFFFLYVTFFIHFYSFLADSSGHLTWIKLYPLQKESDSTLPLHAIKSQM